MGWNYLSIPKLQRCNRWSLGMDKQFYPTLLWACDYLSMLGSKLIHVSKRGSSTSWGNGQDMGRMDASLRNNRLIWKFLSFMVVFAISSDSTNPNWCETASLDMSPWWPLLVLLSWHLVFIPSHCNASQNRGHRIFNQGNYRQKPPFLTLF